MLVRHADHIDFRCVGLEQRCHVLVDADPVHRVVRIRVVVVVVGQKPLTLDPHAVHRDLDEALVEALQRLTEQVDVLAALGLPQKAVALVERDGNVRAHVAGVARNRQANEQDNQIVRVQCLGAVVLDPVMRRLRNEETIGDRS